MIRACACILCVFVDEPMKRNGVQGWGMGSGSPEGAILGRIGTEGFSEDLTFERDLNKIRNEISHGGICGKGILAEGTVKVMALRGREGLADRRQEGQCSWG